jgi:hypothetical protein
LAKISADIAAMDEVFWTAKGSASTETLESLDARRDAALAGISMVADAYAKYFEETPQNAGKLI